MCVLYFFSLFFIFETENKKKETLNMSENIFMFFLKKVGLLCHFLLVFQNASLLEQKVKNLNCLIIL